MRAETGADVIEKALALGYDLAGITRAVVPPEDQAGMRAFVAAGHHGEMHWIPRHLELRLDPAKLFAGAKTAIVLGVLYRNRGMEEALARSRRRIARYTAGRDYHRVLAKKGKRLVRSLGDILPTARFRICVDSAPVAEKVLAVQAGIGWRGKHTNIIHPELGSYFFLSVILTDAVIQHTAFTATDQCGSCRRCIDACPTNALKPYEIDATRCLSYQTIEKKQNLDTPFQQRNDGWVFGCDICQEVCPFNQPQRRRIRFGTEPAFELNDAVRDLLERAAPPEKEEWESTRQGSALGRVSYGKFLLNWQAAGSPGGG